MTHAKFTKPTKRAALKRAKNQCEAVGIMYGLKPNTRCGTSLSHGVEFDHIILDANSKDNSLENCAAVCIPCHRFKTAKHDTPMAAKTVRIFDKANNIRGPKRGFRKPPPGYNPWTRRIEREATE